MEYQNLLLFVLEAIVYFCVMVTLLHFRRTLGLGVFLAALGVMHFMETYLAAVFYVELPFGIVSPGSSVFFAGKLMMILMLYLKEDAAVVRQPIYGIFLGNILTVSIAWLLQFHVAIAVSAGRVADLGFMNEMGWLMVWGTALLYIDSLGIILLYERLGRLFRRHVILRFVLSGLVVLTFDQIGFFAALHYFLNVPFTVFWGGWFAKMMAVGFYGALFALYQFIIRRRSFVVPAQRPIGDVFNDLTFRERYNELLSKSGRDALTGAFDRTRMEIDGAQMLRDSRTLRQPMSLLLLDVDHFKQINDRFGHLRGDEVLRAVAQRIIGGLSPRDQLFRYGGEEFVVLSPATDRAGALVLAEHLRRQVDATAFEESVGHISVSIGIATDDEEFEGFIAMLELADRRLYDAKRAGRNRVVGRSGETKIQ